MTPEAPSQKNAAADASPAAQARASCDHCGLPVPRGLFDEGRDLQFCCNGCRVVYETINACGLDDYYRLREATRAPNERAAATGRSYEAYASDPFLDRYAQRETDGMMAIRLRLEGVHCAACVWLVERLPHIVPGVIQTSLDLRDRVVQVVWNSDEVALSTVAESLDRLGYPPHPARDVSARDVRRRDERSQLIRLGVAGACAGNAMLLALALYAGMFEGIEEEFRTLFRWISLGLGALALAWPGAVFFRGAAAAIQTRTANLDLPIALALSVGGLAGMFNTLTGRGEIYFDSLTVLVFLLLVGRFLQSRQQRWADEAVDLMTSLTPLICRVVREDAVVEEPIDSLQPGDCVEVRSGDVIPADGCVQQGESTLNRALLTGESQAEPVSPGDTVFAGAQNSGATLRIRVEAVGEQTRVARLMQLVDAGVRHKPPIVQFTDRAAGWFVLFVTLAAGATFLAWWRAGHLASAVDHTVALLIVACPCALGLATPLTLAVALGLAAKHDMLIKDAAALERLARGGRLLLDKTGTITRGHVGLIEWIGPTDLQPVVVEMERDSSHPVAKALVDALSDPDQPRGERPQILGRQERGDGGLSAMVDERAVRIGSTRFLERHGVVDLESWAEEIDQNENAGRTVVLVASEGKIQALASLGDDVTPGAHDAIKQLESMGWTASILSGDSPPVVQLVAQQVGVPIERAQGGVDPETKLQIVREKSADRTVMVGDGVNDAAALAAADVGVAMRGGAEASLAAADIYLARSGLAPLVDLVRLARATMRVIRRNLAVSFGYNGLAISLAAAGLINPLIAAILMPISSATVLVLAIGALRWPRKS